MEDLDRSRESLLRVLHHHELRPIFVEFCEQEHNSENVELWLGLQRFNALHAAGDTDKQARYASKIVDKFVRDSAPKQVNMREETRAEAAAALEREDMASLMKIFERLQMIASKELQRDILPRFLTSKLLREHESGLKSPVVVSASSEPNAAAAAEGGTRSTLFSKLRPAASAAAAALTPRDKSRTTSMVHTGKRGARRSSSAGRDGGRGADGGGLSHAPALTAQQEVDRQLAAGWGVGKQQASAFDGVQSGVGSEAALQERSPSTASHHSDGGHTPHADGGAGGGGGGGSGASAEALAVSQKLNKKTRIMGFGFKYHSGEDKARFKQLGAYLVSNAVKDGYVYKRGDKHPTWKRRWVVLAPCMLGYYESQSDLAPKGVVRLTEVTSIVQDAADELDTNKAFSFALVTPARKYYMQASSERDLAKWLQALTEQWQAATSPDAATVP